MRALLISDMHIRFLPPENRTEERFFEDVVMSKLNQVLQIAKEEQVDVILQAGDFFDVYDISRYVLSCIIQLLREYNIPVYTVMGQHDTAYRNFDVINRTASYLLQSAGVVNIVGLDKKPVHLKYGKQKDHPVYVSGISFEQDYKPAPVEGAYNILVAHATVGDRPLYPGHELMSVRSYIKEHKGFNLILLGDIHYEYSDSFMGSQVFNTGPLLRKSIAEKEQQPNVIIYDTVTGTFSKKLLKFTPWQTAFTITEKAVESNKRLQEFIDLIKNDQKLAVSFDDNLVKYYEQHGVSEEAKKHISFALERSNMSNRELKEAQHGS